MNLYRCVECGNVVAVAGKPRKCRNCGRVRHGNPFEHINASEFL